MLSSDLLIICFVFVHRQRYKLFDKRIKPWELPLLFLKEKKNTLTFFTWVKDKPQQEELHAELRFERIVRRDLRFRLNCWIPLHSKRDLEKCGCMATQTRRVWKWLCGYAENLESRLSQTQRGRERAPHLQILFFIHFRKETHFSSFHSFH